MKKRESIVDTRMDYVGQELLNGMCEKLIVMKDEVKKIVLTSSGYGEGKSFVGIRLTQAMANLGYKAVFIDGDFRTKHFFHSEIIPKKCIYSLSSLISDPRLIDMLGDATEEPGEQLTILSGDCENPVALFNSPNFDYLLDKLVEVCDFVFIDTAPLAQVIDAAVIGKKCDAALLVVQYKKTRISDIVEMRNKIESTGCRLLGCIVNGVSFNSFSARKYYSAIFRMRRKDR